jgi:protein-S-isoprenylcysteine O-methyltransferase Ste14
MDIRQSLFEYRSYTPIPFVIAMLFFAKPSLGSMAFGFVVLVIGELIRLWGVSYTGSETRTTGAVGGSKLVTNGPYAHVRNPLYLGNILIYTGFGVMSMALFPWLLILAVIFFVIQYYLIITAEEGYLTKAFREEFRDYCAQVSRFYPRIVPYDLEKQSKIRRNLEEGIHSEKRTLQALAISIVVLAVIWILRG